MICKSCLRAGELNAICNDPDRQTVGKALMQSMAIGEHGNCDGKCDCQHKLGSWVNEFAR